MVDLIKSYVENRIQLIKLGLIGAVSNVAAGLVSSFLLLVMGVLILLMFSVSLAYWFAALFESEVLGFATVGGIYLAFFVIYLLVAKNKVETGIKDTIIEKALAEDPLFEDNTTGHENGE